MADGDDGGDEGDADEDMSMDDQHDAATLFGSLIRESDEKSTIDLTSLDSSMSKEQQREFVNVTAYYILQLIIAYYSFSTVLALQLYYSFSTAYYSFITIVQLITAIKSVFIVQLITAL